ncbi:MAG: metalloregulator ArsR/SmtB family transcription factor [Saprospiraceae bacterium]
MYRNFNNLRKLNESSFSQFFNHLNLNIDMRKQKSETIVLKKGKQEIQLDYAELRKAVLVLRAINHKLRQRMIDLLEEHEKMTVTDIYIKLRLEQSVASQHLAILRRAGVVSTDRNGKFIYYGLDKDRLSQISKLVEELAA